MGPIHIHEVDHQQDIIKYHILYIVVYIQNTILSIHIAFLNSLLRSSENTV